MNKKITSTILISLILLLSITFTTGFAKLIPINTSIPDTTDKGHAWHIETVDNEGSVGSFPSIALDSSNNPHISYGDSTNSDLKYAYHDGSQWNIETVDNGSGAGQYTSIALDSSNNPHISYWYGGTQDLKYAYYDGSQWNTETIDSNDFVGLFTSIALDSSNNPHISYYDL
ncbi:BNR repeat-containing protein, partial [Candidatus Micrarchaeota archaeon]|nr:BNR repeat-containing protein [Candidatus Micrarchaeota archaeon]